MCSENVNAILSIQYVFLLSPSFAFTKDNSVTDERKTKSDDISFMFEKVIFNEHVKIESF